ncbi:MAG: putative DNA binding domain-containing protein [Candidatus Nomurabacteria bacterium]|nr:putative DNA binding domain-containing protein [Candidatus Nomurabacteria bacterium]
MEEEQDILTLILETLKNESNGNELSHIELKINNIDPEEMGCTISAIANVCIYENKEKGYIVYGVTDHDLNAVGVTFDPFNLKYSNQDLELWLRQMILGVDFQFKPFKYDGKDFLIIHISRALGKIATYKKKNYIRIGKNTSDLAYHPEIYKKIMSRLDKSAFWLMSAKSNLRELDILKLLDYETYFKLSQLPTPTEAQPIIERFEQEYFIKKSSGNWLITNLGALLLAREMDSFPSLKYKTPRVITYDGDNKLSTVIKDQLGHKGYASGFEILRKWIDSQIPEPQTITKIFREQRKYYPDEALRELIANALIHQDCEEQGMRPLIEIYKNHIDISNPGNCLVSTKRILGAVPKARNEIVADVMKRLRICETRGSGILRTVEGVEEWQLPAPTFINQENGFKASLYAYKTFDNLSQKEKLHTCEQHVAFMYIQNSFANNETLRKRFGLSEKKSNTISKLVKLAKDKKLIKDFDPNSNSKKFIKYIPIWA